MRHDIVYANVINDGGFEFGMDYVTPVTWKFSRVALKSAYRSLILPGRMNAWAKQQKTIVASWRDLYSVYESLPPA